MTGPSYHARTHIPGGTDPLPTTFQQPFAYIRTSGTRSITADDLTHYVSLQDDGTHTIAEFETSDATIFANASTTAITGSALWGVKLLANGTYRIEWNFQWNGGTSGVVATGYHTINGGDAASRWQGGRTAAKLADGWDQGGGNLHTTFDEFCSASVSNPFPIYVVPYCVVQSGSNPSVSVQGYITYLGAFYGIAL